jgi:DNA modification methylase
MSFPWRKYTKEELLEDYNNLRKNIENTKKITFPLNQSNIGRKCSNFFFQYERMKTRSQNKISCYDFWYKKKSIIENYHKSRSGDLFSTINFLNHCPSQFPPFVAGQIYKYFGASKVLDPFAGWGDRCISAMSMDIDYIGIDSNIHLKPYYSKMIKYFPTNSKVKMIYKKCETVDLNKLDFDFVFTSPPYWRKKDKILSEEYFNSEKDYNLFLHNTLIPFIQKCLKKNENIWICINIPEYMYMDLKKYIGPCKKKLSFKSFGNTKSKNREKNNYIYCY